MQTIVNCIGAGGAVEAHSTEEWVYDWFSKNDVRIATIPTREQLVQRLNLQRFRSLMLGMMARVCRTSLVKCGGTDISEETQAGTKGIMTTCGNPTRIDRLMPASRCRVTIWVEI
jgi:hypothetical protein